MNKAPPVAKQKLQQEAFLVGCADGEPLQPAGVLIAHVAQRSLIVDWLYVDEAYRRRGGASQMMQMLLDCAFEVEEIEDVTLTFSQKHTGMDAFLRAISAHHEVGDMLMAANEHLHLATEGRNVQLNTNSIQRQGDAPVQEQGERAPMEL